MLSSRRKRRCDHCNQLLTIPVYKRHQHLFFDERRNFWRTVGSTYSASSDDDSETRMDEGLNGLQFDSVSMSNGSPELAENNFNAADFTSSLGMCIQYDQQNLFQSYFIHDLLYIMFNFHSLK